jgi:hypothetical protein
MRTLDVDFIDRRPGRWRPVLLWTLAIALCALAGGMAWQAWRLDARVGEQRRETARLSEAIAQRQQAAGAPAVASQAAPPYAADAAEVARIAAFAAQQALAAIESAAVQGINVQSVNVDAVKRDVQLEVQFADYPALLAYIEQLNAGEPAPRWRLSSAITAGGQVATSKAMIVSTW